MKKKVISLMCIALVLFTLVGCDTKMKNVEKKESKKEETTKIKGNCHATECIKKINIDSKVEDINQIIGFDGITKDGKENTYYWEIAKDETIKVVYSGEKATITADIDKKSIADKKVDFSKYSELQPKVKSGITYDTFKSYIGNVDGTITEKSSVSTKYTWVAKSGEYINASFSNSTNQCRFVTGRIKQEK